MIEIRPMAEGYIHVDCMHFGPVDPALPPRRDDGWQDAPDLPPHPWSDRTISELATEYTRITEGWAGDPAREFMREMIRRYGTCAMLAWEDGRIVGHVRFYPLYIARLVASAGSEKEHPVTSGSLVFEDDPGALWVQCVMTCRPYVGPAEATMGGRSFPSMGQAGARRGTGLRLVESLIGWAWERGWTRILVDTRADLDCFYGITGKAGKGFWEKAGFDVIGTTYDEWPKDDDWKASVESQARAVGMSQREAWTRYRVVCDVLRHRSQMPR